MLEQGLNSTEDIQADQFVPFARPRMPQIWPQVGQKWVRPYWVFFPRKNSAKIGSLTPKVAKKEAKLGLNMKK